MTRNVATTGIRAILLTISYPTTFKTTITTATATATATNNNTNNVWDYLKIMLVLVLAYSTHSMGYNYSDIAAKYLSS